MIEADDGYWQLEEEIMNNMERKCKICKKTFRRWCYVAGRHKGDYSHLCPKCYYEMYTLKRLERDEGRFI